MGWSRFFHRSRWDDERARELRAYLAQEIDDNIARGMTPDAAARAAHRKLGNVTRIREEIYDMNTLRWVDAAWQDLRFGMRLLVKNKTFTLVALLTLALGTGANAAIFQLVNALRLRTLPVERPQELVSIGINMHGQGRVGSGYRGRSIFTEPLWQAIRAEEQAFSSLIAWGADVWDLSSEGESRMAQGLYVSGSYFGTLGVRAHAGRLLTESDDQPGCGVAGAVLSHGFWQARYGGNPGVIGQSILLDRRGFEIVGVAPRGFFGVEVGKTFDVAIPMCAEPLMRGRRAGTGERATWWLDIMGRLEPGWTAERAAAHLATISPGIFERTVSPSYTPGWAKTYLTFVLTATPAGTGVSNLRTAYATHLWILLGATALVLLITCANLANLMLARATAREREIAVRLAIGASRSRLVRQMLSESLLLAAIGAAGGLLLARWLSSALVAFLSTAGDRLFLDLAPDWRVFAFIAAVAALACLLFGLSPALKATATNPGKTMQSGGRSATDAQELFAVRRGLVVLQMAVSVVLVVGALLFARSLHNLATVDTGFRQDGIVAASVDLRRTAVQPEGRRQAYDAIMSRVRTAPGVSLAAEAMIVPMSGPEWLQRIEVDGQIRDGMVMFNLVSGDFFRTLGTPLLAGRTFVASDRPGAPPVAVVNETFARRYFGGAPLGKRFTMETGTGVPRSEYHVVGVVKDTKYGDLREEFKPIAYFAMSQETDLQPFVEVVVRSDLAMGSVTPALTRAILDAAPGAAVSYESISTYVRDSLVTERLMASLSGFFGGLATLIATLGLYGVMSYMVTRRQVEIGIRMALGADPGRVVRMVLRESAVLLGFGAGVGVLLAIGASRWAASLLFQLEPSDPLSYALGTAALGLVSLIAAWIPARRASRLAPTVALRE